MVATNARTDRAGANAGVRSTDENIREPQAAKTERKLASVVSHNFSTPNLLLRHDPTLLPSPANCRVIRRRAGRRSGAKEVLGVGRFGASVRTTGGRSFTGVDSETPPHGEGAGIH